MFAEELGIGRMKLEIGRNSNESTIVPWIEDEEGRRTAHNSSTGRV